MMKKEEEQIKKLLSNSTITPTEFFTERIMHRIKSEQTLKPKPDTGLKAIIDYFEILGIGYSVVLILGIFSFVTIGMDFLNSKYFIVLSMMALAISSYSSLFLLWKRVKKQITD